MARLVNRSMEARSLSARRKPKAVTRPTHWPIYRVVLHLGRGARHYGGAMTFLARWPSRRHGRGDRAGGSRRKRGSGERIQGASGVGGIGVLLAPPRAGAAHVVPLGPVGVEQALEDPAQFREGAGDAGSRPRPRGAERIRHRCSGGHGLSSRLHLSSPVLALPWSDAEPPGSREDRATKFVKNW